MGSISTLPPLPPEAGDAAEVACAAAGAGCSTAPATRMDRAIPSARRVSRVPGNSDRLTGSSRYIWSVIRFAQPPFGDELAQFDVGLRLIDANGDEIQIEVFGHLPHVVLPGPGALGQLAERVPRDGSRLARLHIHRVDPPGGDAGDFEGERAVD